MKRTILFVGFMVMLTTSVLLIWRYTSNTPPPIFSDPFISKPEVLLPGLSGVLVKKEISERRPVAVIVENHPDSRPQTGLDKADIVYETVAEGGITRFLALYQTAEEAVIGPVRSARPYFAELASEYGAVFAHVGGSDEVLVSLAAKKYTGVDDANQYFLDDYFDRVKYRVAPHNVYTKLSTLRTLISNKKWHNVATVQPWQYADQTSPGIEPALQVSINFSSLSYSVRFEYDLAIKNYKRFLANIAHSDAETKQQLAVKTLIVQLVSIRDIPNDPKLRVNINLDQGGKAYVFYDGSVVRAEWKKSANRTVYYGVDGKEITLPRGPIWVGLAPDTPGSVVWK
jgi:hypothetical protein